MKYLALFLATFVSLVFFLPQESFALSIFKDKSKVIYCSDGECSLEKGTEMVKNNISDIETTKTASEYIQDIVKYLLTFITLIAVLYIIYAWFRILTSAWEEEWVSSAKKTIVSVALWILVMWLAYAIVRWVIEVITH